MSEKSDALKLAERLLDVPYADPDDDLRVLSRQLLRAHERESARAEYDGMNDLVSSNQEAIIGVYREAFARIRRAASLGDVAKIVDAATAYHPMHEESWQGWPTPEVPRGPDPAG